jgi:hypothetical protein
MPRLAHPRAPGQEAPAARTAFVLFIETRDAFAALEEVAADGLRRPSRRKLTKTDARAKYERACSALAWLLAATTPASSDVHQGPAGSETGWCE